MICGILTYLITLHHQVLAMLPAVTSIRLRYQVVILTANTDEFGRNSIQFSQKHILQTYLNYFMLFCCALTLLAGHQEKHYGTKINASQFGVKRSKVKVTVE